MTDKKRNLKPLAIALSAGLALGIATLPGTASANSNSPFHGQSLKNGYNLAETHHSDSKDAKDAKGEKDHKCSSGNCSGKEKTKDHKCSSGNCSGKEKKKDHSGKCGSGKCSG